VIVASQGSTTQADWFPGQSVPVIEAADLPLDLDFLIATSWPTAFEVLKHPARHHCYFVQSDESRFYDTGSALYRAARLSYNLDLHFLTEARWIQQWLSEDFGKRAALVRNGLDALIFYPDEPLERKGERPRVLLEGAIALPFKGMKEAFEAVAGLDVEVWCVSAQGKPKAGWRCDRFFEKVPMATMRRIYSSCDILLKLSRVEGFFGPPLEMMACGGMCVVGKVSGYDEYIRDRENALVVEPGDVRGARKAVEELISNRDLQQTLKENGFKTSSAWNWESSTDQLEEYFTQIDKGSRITAQVAERIEANQKLLVDYEKILSERGLTHMTVATLAHRIKKKVSNRFLLKAGEHIYLHMLQHREFYSKVLKIKF
jgi:glycosyltransferase involved in cell wall biosynthesis